MTHHKRTAVLAIVFGLLLTSSVTAVTKIQVDTDSAQTLTNKTLASPIFKLAGAVGDGVADDTAAVQAAITAAQTSGFKMQLGDYVYRCTAPLLITKPITVAGVGVSPYEGTIGTRGHGSWLHFDHTGQGILIKGPASAIMGGITLTQFGTFRTQPTPAPGWAPTAYDWDIAIDNSDVFIHDLMLLNPTKGIVLTNGNAGRLEIDRLRGQAFQVMVSVDTSYDSVKINNLHQWPFWKDDANVHAYTMANLNVIDSGRSDNPMVTNLFTIFANSGIHFSQNANGATSKMHLVNADFDRGRYAILVDSSVTNGVTGQFTNVTHQGETGLAGSKAVYVQGNNSVLDFVNFNSALTAQNGVRVEGTGNVLTFGGTLNLTNYDQSATNFPALEALTGNTVRINGLPQISGGGGSGGSYGGAGTIYVDDWRVFTPTVTATTGTITTLGAVTGKYKRVSNTLYFELDITITTNGTGAGAVRATLPNTATSQEMSGHGRETVVAGKMLSGTVGAGTAYCDILNYDNTYPGSNTAHLVVTGSYRIA